MRKQFNWFCRLCERNEDSDTAFTLAQAKKRHREMVERDIAVGRKVQHDFPGQCAGDVRLARAETRVRGPKPEYAGLPFRYLRAADNQMKPAEIIEREIEDAQSDMFDLLELAEEYACCANL